MAQFWKNFMLIRLLLFIDKFIMQSLTTTSTTDGKRLISSDDTKRARTNGIDKALNGAAWKASSNARQNPEGPLNEMKAGYEYALGH